MPDPAGTRPMGVRDVLRLRDYRRLLAAQVISDLGDAMTYLALFLLVLELTGSAAVIAVMAVLVALPSVTIGLAAGAFVDRYDRRRIMIASDIVRAGIVASMVLFAHDGGLPVVFLLAVAQAIVGTFFMPARMSLVPRIVPSEGLLAANSLTQMGRVVAGVLGTGFTGLVAGLAGVVWPAFLIDAVTFLVSAGLVLGVTASLGVPDAAAVAGARERGVGASVGEGLRLIARSRPLLAVLAGISVTMLGLGAVNVLFTPFLVGELGESAAWAGPLEGAQSLSMILASGVVATLAARVRLSRILVGALAGAAAVTASLSLVESAWAMLPVLFAVGWFVTPASAVTMTIVQTETVDAVRGRVSAALHALMNTTTIVSMGAAGILADLVGIRTVFLLSGLVAGLGAVAAAALFRGAPVASPALATAGVEAMSTEDTAGVGVAAA